MDTLPPLLFQKWSHSYEEDNGNIKAYRPHGYDLPPARGRDGFEIQPDGTFTLHGIASTDGTRRILGQWRQIADRTLKIDFEDPKRSPLFLEIIHSEPDFLTLRQPLGQKEDS